MFDWVSPIFDDRPIMTNDVYVVVLAIVAFLWVFLVVMLSRGKSGSEDQDFPGAPKEHDQENAVRLR